MALLLRRLGRASPLAALGGAFREQGKWGAGDGGARRFHLGAAAAVSGGVAFLYAWTSPSMGHLEELSQEASEKVALNPEKWVKFKLHETAKASHNSLLFRFSFDRDAKLGLDVASCILTRAPLGDDAEGKTKYVIRPYTPISDLDSKGYFDLLIKVYPEGKMSQYMASLKPGDELEVKGPIEKFKYHPNMKKQIGMVGLGAEPSSKGFGHGFPAGSQLDIPICFADTSLQPTDVQGRASTRACLVVDNTGICKIAGGTGITPMLQIITTILKNPDDNTQVSLLYANVSPDDILLKGKLDQLAASHPNLKIFYTVDNPSKNWRGGSGYISKDMILKGLPRPGEDAMILVCGPPGMMKHISGEKAKDWTQGELSGLLKEVGYTEEMVYKF